MASHATILTQAVSTTSLSDLKVAFSRTNVHTLSQKRYVWRCPCARADNQGINFRTLGDAGEGTEDNNKCD